MVTFIFEFTLKTYLNETYYSSISATSQSQIDNVIYYLGGRTNDSSTYYGSTEEIYVWERGTEVYNNTRPTSWEGKVALMFPSDMYMIYGKGVDTNCYNDPKQCTTWASPAGRPTTGWIYNTSKLIESDSPQGSWLLSPSAKFSECGFDLGWDGSLSGQGLVYGVAEVRPVFYLKSSIQIIDGEGTEHNPYVLQ